MDKFPSRARPAASALEPRVSGIIVVCHADDTANVRATLDLSLRSLLAEPWVDDLVIVDHGNPPELSSMLRAFQADRRDVKLINSGDVNATVAANMGAAVARGRWLLFLAPDVVLQRGAVSRMAAAGGGAQAPWIVGGRLLNGEGFERPAMRTGVLNTWSAIAVAMDWRAPRPLRRRNLRAEPDDPMQVAAVSGAFMLVPRADFQQLGGFDADFPVDGGDLDLCRRARDAGGSVLFQPAAAGVQFSRAPLRRRDQAHGLALFAAKSARTPLQKAFAAVARPALLMLVAARDFIGGRPPRR